MIKVQDITTELQVLRTYGGLKTKSTGSWQLDQHLRLLKGYPWFIGGQPYHGKTEVAMELLMKWAIEYNWKYYLYFGEGGDVQNIVADLCHKFIGKPYYKGNPYCMSDSERMYAEQFINEHFYFADPNKDISYEQFIKDVAQAERELGFKFDATLIDPFNDLDYDLAKYGNITYWLKDVLKQVRINSKINNRIDMTIVHVGDTQPILDKDSGMYYNPPSLPSQWEGGKIWNRRAFVQINVWKNLQGDTEIIVNKAKPKEAKVYDAKFKATWYWDWKRNRYRENCNGKDKDILESEEKPYNTKIDSDNPPF